MPQISVFLGIAITMYWDDHNPPHFHARYGSDEALICIAPIGVYSGKLPSRVTNLVMEWAALHHAELLANWEKARNKQPLHTIIGLDA